MRTPIVLAVALAALVAGNARAEELSNFEVCRVIGEFSETIMMMRQDGSTPSALMAVATKQGESEPEASIRDMILAAFDVPRFSSDDAKLRARKDFRSTYEAKCFAVAAASGKP